MKKLLFLSLLLLGCVSVNNIAPAVTASITNDAKAVIAIASAPLDSLFDKTMAELLKVGFPILNESKEYGYINTDFKSIGQGTLLKLSVVVTEVDSITSVKFTGQWKADASTAAMVSSLSGSSVQATSAQEVAWAGNGRSKYAFGEMVNFAKTIAGSFDSLSYE